MFGVQGSLAGVLGGSFLDQPLAFALGVQGSLAGVIHPYSSASEEQLEQFLHIGDLA